MDGRASIVLLDETNRPKAPPIAGATDADRRRGGRLAAIHRLHLEEMENVRRVIGQIEAGTAEMARLGPAVTGLQMAQNYRVFGAVCGRECQMLSFHHSAEDSEMFPQLRQQGSDGLGRVIDKLAAEHLVVHALIKELEAAADAAIATPDRQGFETLVEIFGRLEAVVRSHFGYEETELAEALGVYGGI